MMNVYGHPVSTCTRKVLIALEETQIPYEMKVVEMPKGEHKQEPHLSRQPFGQVPSIEEDGFTLYESRAICRYLSAKAGNQLTPDTAQLRAKMDQWMSVEQSNFAPNAMKFIFEYVFKRPQEPAALEAARGMIDKTFAVLSLPLEKSPFLVGDMFTLADINYMPYFEYLMNTPARPSVEKYPHLMAWWERVSTRPSFRKVVGRP